MSLKIIADSVSDIPESIRENLNIEIVPLEVNFEHASYKDGVELKSAEFFKMLRTAEKLPTTSQVNPGEFIEAFKKHLEAGDDIICITLSSKLSGTYNAAMTAKEFLEAGDRITVIDSKSVTLGYGIMVIEAAELLLGGSSKKSIVDKVVSRINNVTNIFVFDTLTNLYKGGRLSKGEAMLGGLLNIKPIITVDDGELKPMDKVRGRKKTIQWTVNKMKESGVDFTKVRVALYHADDYDYMMEFKKVMDEELSVGEWILGEVGAVVGTHSGPGCVAISYVSD